MQFWRSLKSLYFLSRSFMDYALSQPHQLIVNTYSNQIQMDTMLLLHPVPKVNPHTDQAMMLAIFQRV